MKIFEISKQQLNDFISSQKQSQFLQSFEWGEFQKDNGAEVLRFGLDDDGMVFAFSIYLKNLPFGKKYFYSPRINFDNLNETQLNFVIEEIKKIATEKNVIFWRFEPIKKSIVKSQKSIVKTIDVQASKTNILDINKSNDDILRAMHPKTRYNIRLAEKRGVMVRVGTDADFEKFWDLMNETKNRDGFRLHSQDYYKKMLSIDFIELILAEYEGKIIASNIVSYFGDMASYLHGSSSDAQRNVMAPYLIQWFTIQRAKGKSCKFYDFNGIDDKKWPGVTRFKRGFGGEDIVYPGAFDILFSPFIYHLYVAFRWLRRLIGKIAGV